MATIEMWTFTTGTPQNLDLTGFKVEALDGSIGKVDEATHETAVSFIVVDTGPWIFGKKVMIPAGLISEIDPDTEIVFVARTKDEIKNAPEFDEERSRDQSYRDDLAMYYGGRTTAGRTTAGTGPGQGI